jgi:lipopolysaccharide/colanic/teichoic acid biosynthesis glycosyltransferase
MSTSNFKQDNSILVHATTREVATIKFLLIGNLSVGQSINSSFLERCVHTKSLTAASILLNKENNIDAPELIIISQKLNYEELKYFKIWLRNRYSAFVPVVYNEQYLLSSEVAGLRKMRLVDDVVNLAKSWEKLGEKAAFLKKMSRERHLANHNISTREFNACITCRLKRFSDIVLSAMAILLLSPLFLIIALLVRLDSKGPVFYTSPRAGRGFRVFKFYKFRTMEKGADQRIGELENLNLYKNEEGKAAFFKVKDDPRITRIGTFLRNYSLDELPQLFNVLKGDMSIVGNRPLPLKEAAALTTNEWVERFMAPAGITGLWQVSKRGKEDMSDQERISLDIDYARNHTFRDDMKIILKTPGALIQKTNV